MQDVVSILELTKDQFTVYKTIKKEGVENFNAPSEKMVQEIRIRLCGGQKTKRITCDCIIGEKTVLRIRRKMIKEGAL